jgi:hypothetical protein
MIERLIFRIIPAIIFLIFGVLISCLQAQNVVIRGIISDYQTGRVLDMANVTLQPLSGNGGSGTTTDGNGLYQFNNVAAGDYLFMVRYIGYEMHLDTLSIGWNSQNILNHVQMRHSLEELEEMTVLGAGGDDVTPGKTTIRPETFGRAPTPGGSADLASYIQTQPGVVATGDRGGQLFVRGGTPSENMVLMDGTIVYQPFHIVGFFSVFSEDVVSNVDFYAGGFGPRYSGRTSSVMDVRLKNGNLYNQNWSASLSPFVSDLFFESPVRKGKSSVMASLRGSLIEESSEIYLPEKQPMRFNSQLVKYNSSSGDGINCSALLMRTYDRGKLDFDSEEYFKWSNLVTGSRCAGVSAESMVSFIEFNFGLSHFSNEAGGNEGGVRNSQIFRSHLDINLTQYVGKWRLDYGFFTNYRTLTYDISNLFVSLDEKEQSFLSTGGYIKVGIPVGEKFSVEPGLSFTSYLNRVPSSLEPRIQFSWQPRGRLNEEIHGALGVYRQPFVGLTDYRDAGSSFTAWMLLPDTDRRMEARHALLGWRQPLGRFLDVSAEGYYKKIENTPVATWSTVAQFTTDLAYANGTVRGVDARFNLNYRNFFMGLGYGYSITEYTTAQDHFGIWFGEPVQRYNPSHDRRHQINVQTGFEIGKFSTNVSWMYGSGFPFTRPMGFDSYFSFETRPPDVTGDYGKPRVLLDKPFQGQTPDFHRLDISAEQAFDMASIKVKVQVGAINTYNWENLFYYDVFNQRGIYQLPLMPYLSLKMESN